MFSQFQKNQKKKIPTEAEVLFGQYSSIETILTIVKQQISDIDDIGNNKPDKDASDELRRAELLTTKRRYLEFFCKTSVFLFEKVKTEDKKNLAFYLPNIRTLLDIYAKLLFLGNKNLDEQMLNCIYERLYFLKKFSAEQEFNDNCLGYKVYLDKNNHQVLDYNDFSKKKVSSYLFPPLEQIITNVYINKFRPVCFGNDVDIADKAYIIYRAFSNYVHGNMLSKDTYGNEDLWIIRNLVFLLALTATLIDMDVLNNKNKKDIDIWAQDLVNKEKQFGVFYDKNRIKK